MTKPKRKARSRLSKTSENTKRIISARSRQLNKELGNALSSTRNRLKHSPLLLIAILFYFSVYWLITHYHPEQLRNLLLQNSFLPLHLLVLLGNFFLLTFITLSKRWGIAIALTIQWVLILKLQNFNLDLWTMASSLLVGVGGYLLVIGWKKR